MLLIFDCDGVLLDSMLLHNRVESDAYKKLGINIEPEELARRFAGVPLAEEFRIHEKETGIIIPPHYEQEIEKQKYELFSKNVPIIPGVCEMLDQLQVVPKCVASGTRYNELKRNLANAGLDSYFDTNIFSSEMVAHGKPFPDLFLYAAEKMAADPSECIVIEDAVAGIQAASAANMRVFGFVGGSHCDDDHAHRLQAAGAQKIFSDIRLLPNLILDQSKLLQTY